MHKICLGPKKMVRRKYLWSLKKNFGVQKHFVSQKYGSKANIDTKGLSLQKSTTKVV